VVTVLPFTYSIANGFFFGMGAYVVVKAGCWLVAKCLRREANVMPVTVEGEKGVPDPSPGLPAPPIVYHSPSYYNKLMGASQQMMARSQRIVTGGTLTGSNSSHYIAAGDPEAGLGRAAGSGAVGALGGVNAVGVPSDDALRQMSASQRRLALSRSVNQLRTGSFARGGSRSGPSDASMVGARFR
jgi:hypothetical protein